MCQLSEDSYAQEGICYWNSSNSFTKTGILTRLRNSGEYLVLELHGIISKRVEEKVCRIPVTSRICFHNELVSFTSKYSFSINLRAADSQCLIMDE